MGCNTYDNSLNLGQIIRTMSIYLNDSGIWIITSINNLFKDAHPDKDKSCWACGFDFGNRDDLELHIQSHGSNTKEGRYEQTLLTYTQASGDPNT